MSASPEKLALRLLRALKREKDSGKTLLDCRTLSEIGSELRFTESEQSAAVRFLLEKEAINSVKRVDGRMAALPSSQGEALLGTEKDKTAWTMDRRIALLAVIATLVPVVAVLVARCKPQ